MTTGKDQESAWVPARERVTPGYLGRVALGVFGIVVLVFVGLALLNSFFIDYAPDQGRFRIPGPGLDGDGVDGAGTGENGVGEAGGGGSGEASRGEISCEDVLGGVLRVMAFVGGTTALVAGVGLVRNRRDLRAFWKGPWAAGSYACSGLLLVLLGLYLVVRMNCGAGDLRSSSPQGGGGGGGGADGTGDVVRPPIEFDPIFLLWLLVAALVVAGLILGFDYLRSRKDRGGFPDNEDPQMAARKGQFTIRRLLKGGRFESADDVIAAYRVFVKWADSRGMSMQGGETPMEHGRRVAGEYRVPPHAMERFIHAYEVARLSQREPDPEQRSHATRFARQLVSRRGDP